MGFACNVFLSSLQVRSLAHIPIKPQLLVSQGKRSKVSFTNIIGNSVFFITECCCNSLTILEKIIQMLIQLPDSI